MSITPTFSGEVQLAGWSESHNGGCKVTFWLQDSSDLDAFRAMTVRKGNTSGQRLACVLVELGDDDLPVQPPVASMTPGVVDEKTPLGTMAMWLVLRCGEQEFQHWCGTFDPCATKAKNEAMAGDWVKAVCKVASRKDIDGHQEAEKLFHQLIRGPYSKHVLSREYA